ncbi:MAG: transcriptional regulator, partial [Candidatus Saccharibacteria bacterium]|nr:transcriptional regulator [Candidatus Saccharibacteria bacterium]
KLDLSKDTCIPSLKLLGDFWTLRIIDALSSGSLRYCQIQRMADGVNPVTLSTRLKKLEQEHLVKRTEETCDKISVSYELTDLGRSVLPVLDAVNAFSSELAKTTIKV